MSGLYQKLKGSVYSLACLCVGSGNERAVIAGYKDVFDHIMSDLNSTEQQRFLTHLPGALGEKQRRILLNGLAQEYRDCEDWLEYVGGDAWRKYLKEPAVED